MNLTKWLKTKRNEYYDKRLKKRVEKMVIKQLKLDYKFLKKFAQPEIDHAIERAILSGIRHISIYIEDKPIPSIPEGQNSITITLLDFELLDENFNDKTYNKISYILRYHPQDTVTIDDLYRLLESMYLSKKFKVGIYTHLNIESNRPEISLEIEWDWDKL